MSFCGLILWTYVDFCSKISILNVILHVITNLGAMLNQLSVVWFEVNQTSS